VRWCRCWCRVRDGGGGGETDRLCRSPPAMGVALCGEQIRVDAGGYGVGDGECGGSGGRQHMRGRGRRNMAAPRRTGCRPPCALRLCRGDGGGGGGGGWGGGVRGRRCGCRARDGTGGAETGVAVRVAVAAEEGEGGAVGGG